jgi:hypothetical protein
VGLAQQDLLERFIAIGSVTDARARIDFAPAEVECGRWGIAWHMGCLHYPKGRGSGGPG